MISTRRIVRTIVFSILVVVSAIAPIRTHAEIFGSVRGIVHDPQHRPVQGAIVTLKAQTSAYMQTRVSGVDGEFEFSTVPLGEYTVTVTFASFQEQKQDVIVHSDSSPIIHFQMQIATVSATTVVSGDPVIATTDSVTPTTLLNRRDVQETPGASRTNSLAIITDNIPGAYVTHDQLHIRGGHQVSWLVDGVPIPNTNIASNVGPQFDPKDIDYLEVQRGSYDASYGDRTYGVFNMVPRSGFERDKECDLVTSFGNYFQSNDQISCGAHTQRFAYYGSINGNRTNLGLEPPTPQIIHDAANGVGGFGSLIFNVDPKNQLRFVISSRRDYYQIPNSNGQINEVAGVPGAIFLTPYPAGTFFQQDGEQESDTFMNFSWVRTLSHEGLLTVSPFMHYNTANYHSNPNDLPTSTTDDRASNYIGGQVTASATVARNTMNAGYYGFWQRDNQLFGVLFNDESAPNFSDREIVTGNLQEVWFEDKYKPTTWLTLSGGVRQSHFAGSDTENATSPRAGVSLQIPKLNWVFHGFYGHFYQAPPLLTFNGPALQNAASGQGYTFGTLQGERDEEHQFGVTIPFKGWDFDIDTFRTRANNFFDHNNLGESNIFIPVTLTEALVRGWEVTLRSPRLWHRTQLHLAYSNQIGEARGNITGGLIPTDNDATADYAPLDHDQRNTLNVGGQSSLPWRSFVSATVYYGSGFSNGNGPTATGDAPCCSTFDYLPSHVTVDLSAGKDFGENFSLSVTGLNVANRRVMLDDSLTFGGFHFSNPREVFVELRYRFHY